MSSKYLLAAEAVLDILFDLLSPEQISIKIEEPIDKAVTTFQMKRDPSTHSAFNRFISAFVRHLFRYGLRLPRKLSNRQALAEAIIFLDTGYQNENTGGYECAMLDAFDTNSTGIGLVISQLAESIKAVEREKYINWAFATYFSHLDWNAQERIVAVYLKKYEKILPAELLGLDPARLVNHIPSMITDHISTESTVGQVLDGEMYQNSE